MSMRFGRMWAAPRRYRRPREARLYSPGEDMARDIDCRSRGSMISFMVPEVKTYALGAMTW